MVTLKQINLGLLVSLLVVTVSRLFRIGGVDFKFWGKGWGVAETWKRLRSTNRTVVIMSVVIRDETQNHYGAEKMKIIRPLHDQSIYQYCKRYNCDYQKQTTYAYTKRSPRWAKVAMIRDHLGIPTGKRLVWIDADAIVVSNKKLPSPSKDLALANDFGYGKDGRDGRNKTAFSSGVMFIRCTVWSKNFWTKVWAHNDFGKGLSDQRSINYVLSSLPIGEFEEHVEVVDRVRFNAFPRLGPDHPAHASRICNSPPPLQGDARETKTAILHFAGQYGGYCPDGAFHPTILLPVLLHNMGMLESVIKNEELSEWESGAQKVLKARKYHLAGSDARNMFADLENILNAMDAIVTPSKAPPVTVPPIDTLGKISKPITVWSMDMHIATVACVKSILRPMGVTFIDKSLSYDCKKTKSCGNLKVVNANNAETASKGLMKAFYDEYRNDEEFGRANIVMCFHPSSMCEFFLPFMETKRVFVIATTRYEMGRWSPKRWMDWNSNLKRIAADKKNVVGANNHYDRDYITYFTGIIPLYLPSHKTMDGIVYNPTSDDIIVTKIYTGRDDDFPVSRLAIEKRLKTISSSFIPLRTKYKRAYKYEGLATNRAILHVPYQVSIMSLFEQYAMGIPILAPTPSFMWSLHKKYQIMGERTWYTVKNDKRSRSSGLPPWKDGAAKENGYDPNNDIDKKAFIHWVSKGDYWTLKHIVHFDSWQELSEVIENTDFQEVSRKMLQQHALYLKETRESWSKILGG
jgi:hypothetical protein